MDKPPAATEEVAKTVIGMSEQDAIDKLEAAGLTTRVVYRDGQDLPATKDYSPTRVNLWIEKNIVTKTSVG